MSPRAVPVARDPAAAQKMRYFRRISKLVPAELPDRCRTALRLVMPKYSVHPGAFLAASESLFDRSLFRLRSRTVSSPEYKSLRLAFCSLMVRLKLIEESEVNAHQRSYPRSPRSGARCMFGILSYSSLIDARAQHVTRTSLRSSLDLLFGECSLGKLRDDRGAQCREDCCSYLRRVDRDLIVLDRCQDG